MSTTAVLCVIVVHCSFAKNASLGYRLTMPHLCCIVHQIKLPAEWELRNALQSHTHCCLIKTLPTTNALQGMHTPQATSHLHVHTVQVHMC